MSNNMNGTGCRGRADLSHFRVSPFPVARKALKYPGRTALRSIRLYILLPLVCTLAISQASAAEEDRGILGFALTISNDSIGDWRDRWRSSSVEVGMLTGPDGTTQLPQGLWSLTEYRFRSDVLMPEDVNDPHPDDRRHAGVLTFGFHTYSGLGQYEMRLGADLVMIGEQTGLYDFQTDLHELFGFDIPNLTDFQIGNTVRVDVSMETGRMFDRGGWGVRPFVAIRAGTEEMVRAGLDVVSGGGPHDLTMRTVTTGHRVPYGLAGDRGTRFVVGVDIAWVNRSLFLPENLGYRLTDARVRLRAGFHHTGERFDFFYGTSWLGEEFKAQPEGQFVGTLQVKYEF